MNMNYTDTYRKIYEVISDLDLPHEKKHRAALKITDSLSQIYMYSNKQFPEVLPQILEIAKDFCADAKIGGYDLDDKGQILGFGINATGLNNNK
jgi:hypothetical protein